jgi:hypothetical protein
LVSIPQRIPPAFLGASLPPANDVFDFISAASLEFSAINFVVTGFGIGATYSETIANGVLAFDVIDPGRPAGLVPEPGTLEILGASLLAFACSGAVRARRAGYARHDEKVNC